MSEPLPSTESKLRMDQSLPRAVDLSTSENETIHAIHPPGYLLVLSSTDKTILQSSVNIAELFDAPVIDVIGHLLKEFIEPSFLQPFEFYVRLAVKSFLPLQFVVRSKIGRLTEISCIAHSFEDDFLILEIEPATKLSNMLQPERISTALIRLHSSDSIEDLVLVAAEEARNLTNYERVIVCKFGTDGQSEVLAEAKSENTISLVGSYYPTADTPEQPGERFKRNSIRMIANVDEPVIPILPTLDPVSYSSLDMSNCLFRAAAPEQIEYLKNIGVQATLTISIVVKGKLWGLIACHHTSPLNQPHWVRTAGQLIGQTLSLKLLSLNENAFLDSQSIMLQVVDELVVNVRSNKGDLLQAFEIVQERLKELFDAKSFAWAVEDEVTVYGDAPSNNMIRECVAMLNKAGRKSFYNADAREVENLDLPESVKGFLALRIGLIADEWLIFFRQAQMQVVSAPEKTVSPAGGGYIRSSERSVTAWTQEGRNHSAPWTELQIQIGDILQTKLLLLRRESLDVDRATKKGIEQREVDSVAAIIHDLKNPVLGALKVLELVKAGRMGKSIADVSEILQEVIDSQEILLSRIKSITLGYQHADGAPQLTRNTISLRTVLEKSTKLCRKCAKSEQKFSVDMDECDLLVYGDEDALSRVFENLFINAFKYAPYDGRIQVTTRTANASVQVSVFNSGDGIAQVELPRVFLRFWRGAQKDTPISGNGLGLYICKKIVEAHGGTIKCCSKTGIGTTFILTLPLLKLAENNSKSGVLKL